MKKLQRLIPALIGAALIFQSASAMSFVQPYGYTVPLEQVVSRPKSFESECYAQTKGIYEYDGENLTVTGDANAMDCIYVGGNGYGGNIYTQPLNHGRQESKVTLSLTKGKYFGNSELGYTLENMDYYGFYYTSGSAGSSPFGFKLYYATADSDYCYFQARMGSQNVTGIRVDYGVKYTYTLQCDVQAKTLRAILTSEDGTVVTDITEPVANLTGCQNGFRFRLSNTFDALVSEMSTVRDAFVVKDRTIESDGTNITAKVDVAPNAVARSAYGDFPSATPLLLVGEFDSENRMTSFATDSQSVAAPSDFSADPEYVTLSATLPITRNGAYANACLWSDMDTMLSYGDMLNESIK